MSVRCETIIAFMEKLAPSYLAEPWDNVGLQIGSKDATVKNVMIALDATEAVVDEAIAKEVDLIITHHPLIFKPLKNITMENATGRIIHKLIKHNISVYCSHTNLDMAETGTNEVLAQRIGLVNIKPFIGTKHEKYFKLIVFVPEKHLESVRNAICEAGAGHIGNYSSCTFVTNGTGTFMPLEGSNPYIGTLQSLESVEECRLETIIEKENMAKVLSKMLEAHPYEEVAYDIISLENQYHKYGLARVGNIPHPMEISLFCEEIKQNLGLSSVKVVGDVNRVVQKIGVCSGSGASFIADAHKMGCDCFITGDVKYHDAQYALELGMTVIDAGHFGTEQLICDALVEQLNAYVIENHLEVSVFSSSTYINPFQTL